MEVVSLTTYLKEKFDKATGKLVLAKEKMSKEEEQQAMKDFAGFHKVAHRIMLLPVQKEGTRLQKDFSGFRDIPVLVLIDRQGVVRLAQPWPAGKASSLAELVGKQTKPVDELLPKLLAGKE